MDKEQLAIARLQDAARLSEHRYKKPLMVTYSGGKDSQVLVAPAERAGMDVFRWWMEDDNISGQLSIDDLMEDNNGTAEP